MRTVSLYLVGLFLALASAAWADHALDPEDKSKRPKIELGQVPKVIQEITASVFNLSNEYVDKRYRDYLPPALKDLFERSSESDIAEILAELFGTLDDKQVDDLIKTVKQVKGALPQTPENAGADAYLERLLWAAKIVRADATVESKALFPSGAQFEKEFRYYFARVQRASQSFYATLEKAKSGDEDAKRSLLDDRNYDPDVMSRFLGGKVKSGNRTLSTDLAEALAERNEAGEHFVDLTARVDNRPTRVFLGDTSEQIFDSLSQFNRNELPNDAKPGGFDSFRSAPRRHTDEEIARGQIFRPVASKPTGKPKPFAKKVAPKTPAPITPPTEATPSVEVLDKAIAALMKANRCTGCHGKSSEPPIFDKDGSFLTDSTVSKGRLLEVLNGQNLEAGGTMVDKIAALKLTDGDKKLLGQWGKAQGVPNERNPFADK